MHVELSVNGRLESLDVPPLRRLLDILREDLGLTGTKEGCGEGECGACAVLLDGMLVNSCLVPALQLHGRNVLTIEGLGTEQNPDPIQKSFLEEGAIQCGFCTPGMVIASRFLLNGRPSPSREEIRVALAGNLCRCTGYEAIVRAVERAARSTKGIPSPSAAREPASRPRPPASLKAALNGLRDKGDQITIVAGATDLLTNVRLGLIDPHTLMDITGIEELKGICRVDGTIEIGAATTMAAVGADPIVAEHLPALAQAALLFGAVAIQNRATLGGNLMSASPAADTPPALMALDATVLLACASGTREVPLSSFFTGYRQTVRRPDELLLKVRVPIPPAGTRQSFVKVGTRRAQTIAKVSIACRVRVAGPQRLLEGVRVAAGSLAPTPILLEEVQRHLEGRRLTQEVAARAGRMVSDLVSPIDDVRSTAHYRRTIAGNLVTRFLREILG